MKSKNNVHPSATQQRYNRLFDIHLNYVRLQGWGDTLDRRYVSIFISHQKAIKPRKEGGEEEQEEEIHNDDVSDDSVSDDKDYDGAGVEYNGGGLDETDHNHAYKNEQQ